MRRQLSRFESLPDDARVWVYGFDRVPDADTLSRMSDVLDHFIKTWVSHDVPVQGAYAILEDRFLVFAGHCSDGISGCSTDASVRVVKALRDHFDVDGLDRSRVFFRDENDRVTSLSRVDFQRKVEAGILGPGTVVFDNTIHDLSDLRAGKFETTFEKSWHARAFTR
jgi:hypothetical protein